MVTGGGRKPRLHPRNGPALPIRLAVTDGEAVDSYLERLAAANNMRGPELLRALGSNHLAYLPIDVPTETLARLSSLSGQSQQLLTQGVLASHAGIGATAWQSKWRQAGRAWAPGRRSQLCPACLSTTGAWRIAWRHPWITVCLDHHIWLQATCPTCGSPFRSQRHSILRTIDADPETCGNLVGEKGRRCDQDLSSLDRLAAPPQVLESQHRIHNAVHHESVDVFGSAVVGNAYLDDLKALTVLLLHLACQPGAEPVAPWAATARLDRARSAAGRGARWALAPPSDPVLRGHALAAADTILAADGLQDAAQRFGPWVDVTPHQHESQVGWLADHTTPTPLLTQLIMVATSTRRRLSTQLAQRPPLDPARIPQVVPARLYAPHLCDLIDVTDTTGRLFASLCLMRLGRPGLTWADAARTLGLPPDLGMKTARACSADLLCSTAAFVDAITALGMQLRCDDYADRTTAVRRLAATTRWYQRWARRNTPGARATSRRYAVTWLWTEYAGSHLATSPGWTQAPTPADRAYFRRYTARLNSAACRELLALVTERESDNT